MNAQTQPQSAVEFDPRRFTSAPLRMEGVVRFDAPPERVFAKIADHQGMVGWVPMMKSVRVDHLGSAAPGTCGVGSVRHCSVQGMGQIRETIVYWEPPRGYAYRAAAKMMPTKNHLAVMLVRSDQCGGSLLIWRHYFHYKGFMMRWMFPFMFTSMMNKAIDNLRKELGGQRTKVRRVA